MTITTEALLLVETGDGIATLTLNRPNQFNALSGALLADLQSALDRIAGDPAVRVVVLAGARARVLRRPRPQELRAMASVDEVEALFARCSRMMMTIAQLPQPVIAKVHGLATAAGCQLVATCDLAVASSTATFATPGVNIGAFCSTPGRGARAAPWDASTRWACCSPASRWAPQHARDIGLVNRVVAPDALDAEVEALAKLIASKSPVRSPPANACSTSSSRCRSVRPTRWPATPSPATSWATTARKAWTPFSASARRSGRRASRCRQSR
jgi:enoyl-CoA hydratase/carnithine racemase